MSYLAVLLLLARLVTVRVEVQYELNGARWFTATETAIMLRTGDVTGDGKVTLLDVLVILRWVLDGQYPDLQRPDADFNQNGRADIGDAVLCLRQAIGAR